MWSARTQAPIVALTERELMSPTENCFRHVSLKGNKPPMTDVKPQPDAQSFSCRFFPSARSVPQGLQSWFCCSFGSRSLWIQVPWRSTPCSWLARRWQARGSPMGCRDWAATSHGRRLRAAACRIRLPSGKAAGRCRRCRPVSVISSQRWRHGRLLLLCFQH